jgi:hypothetical protein
MMNTREMLANLKEREFIGMSFTDVLVDLSARGIIPTEVEVPEDEYGGSITIGSIYLDYYEIEFDEFGICDGCYHGSCEE